MTYDRAGRTLIVVGKDYTEPWPQSNLYINVYSSNGTWSSGPHPVNAHTESDPEITYDAGRGVLVLYTGHETWELSGGSWALRDTATDPVNCPDGALLIYDPDRGQSVLVGNTDPFGSPDSETWLYDGTNWRKHNGPSPSNAVLGSMCYDSLRRETVLLTRDRMQTFVFDGTNWYERMPDVFPSPPVGFQDMAFDPSSGLCVVFGGEGGEWPLYWYPVDTWGWDGTTWQRLYTDETPPPCIDYAIAYFPERESVVLHGGWGDPDWLARDATYEFTPREHHPVYSDRIVFCASNETPNGTYDIYTLELGGTPQRITSNTVSEWGPQVAADGTIAYIRKDTNDPPNIYLTDLNGRTPTLVNNSHRATAVQWGDTTTLLYLAEIAGGNTPQYPVWEIGTDGNGERKHYDSTYQSWRLGIDDFHVDRDRQRVHVASFSGSPPRSLLGSGPLGGSDIDHIRLGDPEDNDDYHPCVSPDGSRVAWSGDKVTGDGPGYHYIHIGGMQTGEAVRVVSDPFCGNPEWTSDGKHVVYTRGETSTWGVASYAGDIWRVRYNGEGKVPVTRQFQDIAGSCACPTVHSEPQNYWIGQVQRQGDYSSIEWESSDACTYWITTTSNLQGGAWESVVSNLTGTAGTFSYTGMTSTAATQFYRIGGAPKPLPPP